MKTKYYVSAASVLKDYVSVEELESIFDERKYQDLGNGFEGIVIDDFKGKKVVMWKDDMYNRYLQEYKVDSDGEFEMDEEWAEIYDLKSLTKDVRIELNMTQKELAEILGCNYQTLQRWEYGTKKPSAKYLIKLLELKSKD
jgi:DNA-binding transcriptional regulator YiaG